jgi:tetratricopeptide (TPR) repeat protein
MYQAFISYSHSDGSFARWLHRRLERYRLPKSISVNYPTRKPFVPVFRDEEELATSSDLSTSIRRALDQSERLVVLCSEQAAASRWVNQEIEYFQSLGRGSEIYCVLVSGTPHEAFPPALRDQEPLAADFREDAGGAHGRRDALLRLMAGMLSLGLDDLRRREAQARQRRILAVGAVASLVAIVTTTLAVFAVLGQRRAEQQARVAEEVSGFLTGLFEVSDPGIAQGREITLREMLDRGADQVADQFQSDPLVGAQLAVTMADVYGNLRETDPSIALYRRAADVYAERPGARVSYGRVLRRMADQQLGAGALDEAERSARAALAQHRGDSAAVRLEAAADQAQLAKILFQQGQDKNVEPLYQSALQTRERLLSDDDLQVAESRLQLGWYYLSRFDYLVAEPLLRSAFEVRLARLGERHFLTLDAMDKLGALYEETGRLSKALTLRQRSLEAKQAVLDPPHPLLAESLVSLAGVQLSLDAPGRALELAQQAVSMAEQHYGPVHSDLARGLNIQDMALQALGRFDAALPVAERVLHIYEQTLGGEHELVGQALNNLGALLAEQLGHPERAEPLLRRAVRVFATLDNAQDWQALATWSLANALREQQKYREAEPVYRSAMALVDYGEQIRMSWFPPYADLVADFERSQAGLQAAAKRLEVYP